MAASRVMSQGWQRVWTDDQKEAVAAAYLDRGIRPYRRILEQAKAGELRLNGTELDAFDMPLNTARSCVIALKRRRAGLLTGLLAGKPDAAQILKRRLIDAADAELRAWERGRVGKRDMERHRQISRAVREAAAIPERTETAVKPGAHIPGEGRLNGGPTVGGLGGQIIKAHTRAGTAQTPHPAETQEEHSTTRAQGAAPTEHHAPQDHSEGTLHGEQHGEELGPVPT